MDEAVEALAALVESQGTGLNFQRFAEALRRALDGAGVYVADRSGRLLGAASPLRAEAAASADPWAESGHLPDSVAVSAARLSAPAWGGEARAIAGAQAFAVIPLAGAGRRTGTLLVVAPPQPPDSRTRVLARLAAALAGLVLAEVRAIEEDRLLNERQRARSAVRSLTYTELTAVQQLFGQLEGDEGILVTSRIADQAGITRSVLVNALRKLASGGVIESRSLGARGTYLRLLNRELRPELIRRRQLRSGPSAVTRRG